MQAEDIEKFLSKKDLDSSYIKISFKQRDPIYGLFIKDADYSYLKSKNFWRIVPQSQLDAFKNTGNTQLAKIFSGADFSRLTTYEDSFE